MTSRDVTIFITKRHNYILMGLDLVICIILIIYNDYVHEMCLLHFNNVSHTPDEAKRTYALTGAFHYVYQHP